MEWPRPESRTQETPRERFMVVSEVSRPFTRYGYGDLPGSRYLEPWESDDRRERDDRRRAGNDEEPDPDVPLLEPVRLRDQE